MGSASHLCPGWHLSGSGPAEGGRPAEGPEETVLRAKYLDYCSARVAEVILQLTADEIYLLAQEAARAAAPEGGISYEEVVRLATERLFSTLALPSFESWTEAYRKDPARFDRELLGLWESELSGSESRGGPSHSSS